MEVHLLTVVQILTPVLIAVVGFFIKGIREDIKNLVSKDLCEAHRKTMDEKIEACERFCKHYKE